MKFPSIQTLLDESKKTLLRFPLELICALAATCVWIHFIDNRYNSDDLDAHLKLLFPCFLGMLLYLSSTLFSESKVLGKRKWLLHGFVTLFLVIYYFTLDRELTERTYIRFALMSLGFHLLVSFSPFLGKENLNGFWQFNKTIFLRILTAILFSGVLYLGLAGALLAVDSLFNVEIPSERYFQLWTIIAGVFNTWFFLAGVPENVESLENEQAYPKGLKVFTQYVLVPLVTIYLFILYAYEVKIIAAWSLPKGWVSYLVIGYAIAGILSILLIYPVRNTEGNRWINIFSKWFYLALFPLVVLLLFAIGIRVKEYGITENRYFVLVLALWLLFVALYFLLNKKQNIKVIPISLFVLALLSSWGPQSAFSISELSQFQRLKYLLTKHDVLQNEKIRKAPREIPFKDQKAISTIVEYLQENHGNESLQPLFTQNLDSIKIPRYSTPDTIMKLMGLKFLYRWETENNNYYRYVTASSENNQVVDVKAYDYLLFIGSFHSPITLTDQQKRLKLEAKANDAIVFTVDGKDSIRFRLNTIAKRITVKESANDNLIKLPPSDLSLTDSLSGYKVKLVLQNMDLDLENKKRKINSWNGYVLVKRK